MKVQISGQGEVKQVARFAIFHQRRQRPFFVQDLGDGARLEMVEIPGGEFLMGAPQEEKGSVDEERPQHQVRIQSFCMGRYPITQAQWQAVAALPKEKIDLVPNLFFFKGDNRPVAYVSWYDAVEFCARLTWKTGREYRLPTEAEWEYACRAGTTTPFHFGATITPELANYDTKDSYRNAPAEKSRGETTPVGSFGVANAFGLYDMHGNVREWCADHWHKNYRGAPTDGSAWLSNNENSCRPLRGGSWVTIPGVCRSECRHWDDPGVRNGSYGFRVVCSTLREG